MKTSECIDKLAEALAAAQGEFTNPDRNREVRVETKSGGEYRFTYSTLDCVMDMARPILARHGLSITQPPTVRDGQVIVLTRLMHASGQWQEEEIPVRPESFGPQQIGSAITYLKRYAYCGMLGIASDEDDDGNGASGNEIKTTQTRQKETLPHCPQCGKDATIESKFDEPGTLFCFPKKGGCGHKWLSVKALADKAGMTTGDKVPPPKNGKGESGPNETMSKVREYAQRLGECVSLDYLAEIRADLEKEPETIRRHPEIAATGIIAKVRSMQCQPQDSDDWVKQFSEAVKLLKDDETWDGLDLWMASEGTMGLFSDDHWRAMQRAVRSARKPAGAR